MKALAALTVAAALAAPAQFVQAHQSEDGGFAEQGGGASPALTAWAVLGLRAVSADAGNALDYLRAHDADVKSPPTRALVAMAAAALGDHGPAQALPVTAEQTNTIIWTILARRQAGLDAPRALVRALLVRQAKNGGWGWGRGVAPDSNDTAVAVQALRSAGVSGASIRRALRYLETARNGDGGYALVPRRESDAQSTAWAVQAYLAVGARPPRGALAYLRRLRRADGSYRYSKRYAVTPVWVTAQVLPALAGTPFPLR